MPDGLNSLPNPVPCRQLSFRRNRTIKQIIMAVLTVGRFFAMRLLQVVSDL
jgi:hypothetical protein